MTSQPSPGDKPASQFTTPLRELAALVLVSATAVLLFAALIGLFPRGGYPAGYLDYASSRFGGFVNLATIAFPLVAVLLATHLEPRVDRAALITVGALVELAVAAFFGLFFGMFLGFIGDVTGGSGRAALEGLLTRVAYLGVLGVVLYAVFRVWQGLYYVPRPSSAPTGGYGRPQPGSGQPGNSHGQAQPPTYGQPGYAQQPGSASPATPPAPAGPPDDPFRTQVIRPAEDSPVDSSDQPTQRWEP